ncbi:MAG: hypothetical protein AAFV30_07080, partial [Pseudomonadota bacterium]
MSTRFLEISVTSHDLVTSLNFYRALGFTELTTADTWPHPYAVVTDGQVAIGLHGQAFEAPRIALSMPDLQRAALQLGDNPRLQSMRIDPESFHEVLLADEDHHALWLLEARTYSPASETPPRAARARGGPHQRAAPRESSLGRCALTAAWGCHPAGA